MKKWYQGIWRDNDIYFELLLDLFVDAIELVLEPENVFDENAIAVVIYVDNDLVKIG